MAKNSKSVESARPAQIESKDAVPTENETKQAARVYIDAQEYDHDLFKLSVAKMTKNIAIQDQKPEFHAVEHVHFFHTIDSSGRKQTMSTAIGGHFHLVTVVGEKGGVPILEISEPRKFVSRKKYGKVQRDIGKVLLEKDHEDGENLYDTHTHEYVYLGSHKIKARVPNKEFAQFDSSIKAHREPSVEGVKG